jgi:hypothetical protein
MKRLSILGACLIATLNIQQAAAQTSLGDKLKKAVGTLTGPSSAEIGAGLKEALEAGVFAGTDRLSAVDGFLKNAAVKLLFPPEAQKAEKTLRSMGLNKLCDDMILSMNRAAGEAVKEAKPIFVSAIRQMSFSDAANILLGGQPDAATQYFKNATSSQLIAAFTPVIRKNLEKTGATRYWTDVATAYNKIPLVTRINPDLTRYAAQKTTDGLFHEIAGEELKIRNNAAFRTSPTMKKVFAYADIRKQR